MKPTVKNVDTFLRESNAIEDVWDQVSMRDARKAWKFIMNFDTLNVQIVKETHKMLMVSQDIEHKYKGEFRDVPVYIGGEKKSDSPLVIGEKLRLLIAHIHEVMKNKDLNHEVPACCHIKFEEIHPFIDGNGRIGRILMNWQLVKMGLPLTVYYADDRRTYYRLFPSYRARELGDMMEMMKRMNWKDL